MKPIIVVQGGNWGSEAKGAIAAYLCETRNVDFAVRTGAVNAGHTVYHDGIPYKMQTIPTGWVNPNTKLVIGAGAYLNRDILLSEMKMIDDAMGEGNAIQRLFIDYRAGIHESDHTKRSSESGRHHGIGATGKGCSEAIADKIKNRGKKPGWFSQVAGIDGLQYVDSEKMLNDAYDAGKRILIEGTQGDGLDLHLGPYPYTTHKQTTVANWLSEVGLSPSLKYEICMVLRTYPIRVAGNSGPMPKEISWMKLAIRINARRAECGMSLIVEYSALQEYDAVCREIAGQFSLPDGAYDFENWWPSKREAYKMQISEFHRIVLDTVSPACRVELEKLFEMTTVTHKLRRIAELDPPTVKAAIRRIRPSYIALTFLNYVYPELWNATELSDGARQTLYEMEEMYGMPILMTSTGPLSKHIIEKKRSWREE